MAKRKSSFPKIAGQVLIFPFEVFDHHKFQKLSGNAKSLMFLLQRYWRNDRPIQMGVRQVANFLHVSHPTVRKCFNELITAGFIEEMTGSYLNTFSGIKIPRAWKINWMAYEYLKPSCDWLDETEKESIKFRN